MATQKELCKECFQKNNKRWSSIHDSDLDEGTCPLRQAEICTCEVTGERITATGKIKLVRCGVHA